MGVAVWKYVADLKRSGCQGEVKGVGQLTAFVQDGCLNWFGHGAWQKVHLVDQCAEASFCSD